MEQVLRKRYIQKVKPFVNTDVIKVLIGQRRVGKSVFMKQVIEQLLIGVPPENIVYIDKENRKFENINNYQQLEKYLVTVFKKSQNDHKKYLFIDEIQEIEGFEKVIRSYNTDECYDVYISGSNSSIISSELSTLLTGRYVEIEITPFSYQEFLLSRNAQSSADMLNKYMEIGGMPFLAKLDLDDKEAISNYHESLISTILLKDIVSRYAIRNVDFLNKLIHYIASHTGSLISAKRISDFLTGQKVGMTPTSVLEYLEHVKSAFLIHQVKREDLLGKKIFEINPKYYFNDIGIRNHLGGISEFALPQILEGMVYSHLKFNGYNIRVGKISNREIDFKVEKNNEIKYVQASYNIQNYDTAKREFNNLIDIPDNYEKIVVTMQNPKFETQYKGVKLIGLEEFLLTFE